MSIPDDCNKRLKPVPHASVAGDQAKIAWRKERVQLNRANARITSGAECWNGVVTSYRGG